jgi:hypothetical protein
MFRKRERGKGKGEMGARAGYSSMLDLSFPISHFPFPAVPLPPPIQL